LERGLESKKGVFEVLRKSIKSVFLFALLMLLLFSGLSGIAYPQATNDGDAPFGVWWWNTQAAEMERLMDFAASQGVTEIYWSAGFTRPHWSEEATLAFLSAAHERGIAVYYLTGDWNWIHDDTGLIARLEAFLMWQESAPAAAHFSGVHLNIEPHQDPAWGDLDGAGRNALLQRYIDLKVRITDRFGPMDWSIPFWWREDAQQRVYYRGTMTYLYRASILEADRVFVMSYRNTAEEAYRISTHYLAFARETGRSIFLSALANQGAERDTDDHVFFYFLGYRYMMDELAALGEMVDDPALAIAIHGINGWYQMWRRYAAGEDGWHLAKQRNENMYIKLGLR